MIIALALWGGVHHSVAASPAAKFKSSWVYEFSTPLFVCVVWQGAEKPSFGPRATAIWCMPRPLMPEVPIMPDPPKEREVRGTRAPAFLVDVTNRTP